MCESLHEQAVRMRRSPTEAEAVVWRRIRRNRLGVKFRRQHVINRFIVDFYCPELALAVEIDGRVHETQQERDKERESILRGVGCCIIRFKNEQVLTAPNVVVREI